MMDVVKKSGLALGAALAMSLAMGVAGSAVAQTQHTSGGGMPHQGGPGMDGPHGRPPSPAEMFAQMDTNHDGMISKAEFDAFHARHHMGPPGGDHGERGPGGPPPR